MLDKGEGQQAWSEHRINRSGLRHMVFGQATAVSLLCEYALANEGCVGFFLSRSSLGLEPGHEGERG